MCPCPLPPTLLRPRLATARRNELSCRWEPGGSRREGIQELLIDSLLAFMEIVVKLQFVALMIFRWSRLESTHFTNCFDFFLFPRADLHEVAHKSSLFLFNYCLIRLVNSCSWFSKPSESNLGCICKTNFGKKKNKKMPRDHWFKNLNWAIYTTETKCKRWIPSCFSACPPMPTACLVIITFSSPRGQYCLSLSQAIKQKNVAGFFYFPTHHCVCFSLLWRDTPHTHPKNVGECVGEPFPSLARKLVHKNVYLERLCPGYGLFTAVK